MPYSYQKERPFVFTEDGVDKTLKIYDRFKKLFKIAGACMYYELTAYVIGDTWETLACVDYLEEKEKIKCVNPDAITQYRVYTLPYAELMGA